MKIKFISYAMMALAMGFTFSACGDDDDKKAGDNGEGIEVPEENDDRTSTSMSSKEQKEVLETTARELIAKVNANDFKPITDLGKYVKENIIHSSKYDYNQDTYVEKGLDDDAINEWFGNCVELCMGNMVNNVQRNVYLAANFTGRFVAGDEAWEYFETSNGLEFEFKDMNNKKCVLRVEASDRYKKVYFPWLSETHKKWIDNSYVRQRYETVLGVPELINVTLTQNGNTLVSAKVTTELTVNSEEIDLSADNYVVTADINTCGYRINVEKCEYMADKKAYVSTKVTKNNATLIALEAEANGQVRLTKEDNGYKEWDEFKVREAGRAAFKFDVLGKVQAIGEVKDIDKVRNYLEKANEYKDNGNKYKEYLAQANELLNIGLHYYGKSQRMATFKLGASSYRDYGEVRYEMVPTLYFDDGTSYSCEEYFDETYFKKVLDNFKNLMEDFEELVEN